jgi:hypothetical protein
MLITYHISHVKEILKNFPDYFKEFEANNRKYRYITLQTLIEGLIYPDVPCSHVIMTERGVKYMHYSSCKIPLSLVYLSNEEDNGLKEVVQSHRGRFSITHSMTYDPNVPMIDLRQKILRRIEILYHLALKDNSNLDSRQTYPNMFWLGQIIHCVQDSYSRVHTLRRMTRQKTGIKKLKYKRNTIMSSHESKYKTFKLVKYMSELLDKKNYNITNDDNESIQRFLFKHINDEELLHIVRNNPDDIGQMFKQFVFFKKQKKRIHTLYHGEHLLPSTKCINKHTSDFKRYPYIMSFRYIPHQNNCNKLFHFHYDKEEPTQELGFDKYMNANIHFILETYKRHVLDNTKPMCAKIDEMIHYVAKNVFPILHGYEKNPSAIKSNLDECDLSLKNVYRYHAKALKEI